MPRIEKGGIELKISKNRIIGAVCALLSVAYLAMALQIPATTMEGDPGPQLFPYIAGGLMLISSLVMLFRRPRPNDTKPWMTPEQLRRLWGLFGIMVLYVLLLNLIGYTLSTFLVLLTVCLLFAKGRAKVPLWQVIVYSAVITVLVYAIFTQVLGVSLPLGKIKALNFLTAFF